eukprot:Gb_01439 [translate_table: standard]
MEKLQCRIHEVDPMWRSSAFMVDDVATKINDISLTYITQYLILLCLICTDVFGCRVLLCLWHVRRSWLKNLTKNCHDYMVRREMFKDLGDIMYNQSHATNIMETIECFMHKYRDQTEFLDYFRKRWMHRIDMRVKAMWRLPHSNQEKNGAIEAYHGTWKYRLSRGTNMLVDLDWLVHFLSTRVHAYYLFGQYRKSNGFVQNLHADEYKTSAWFKVL